MKTCKWCTSQINPTMMDECVSCWSLRSRIQAKPEITRKMLEKLFDGKYSGYTIGGKDGK